MLTPERLSREFAEESRRRRNFCAGGLGIMCSVLGKLIEKPLAGLPYPRPKTESRPLLRPEDLPILHHEIDILQHFDVAQRIATHRDYVGIRARSDHADLS